MRDHVIYESHLELSRLLLADFDPAVRRILAQPLMLTATVQGHPRRHIPDYLWDTADGPVVVDVVRAERLAHSDVGLLCRWTCAVVESLGWHYRVLSEPSQVHLVNVSFLASCRRGWLIDAQVLREMRCRTTDLTGLTIAEAESEFAAHPQPLVRPALMHLLWCHELYVDLDRPLRPSTVLEVPR
jgi:hypothetical protein